MKKFEANVFCTKLGEDFGKKMQVWAEDAFEATEKFCKVCTKLGEKGKFTFDFNKFKCID